MGATDQRTSGTDAEREPERDLLQQAVDEAERALVEGRIVDHDDMRVKLRRWASSDV